jgi:hypothetical protein
MSNKYIYTGWKLYRDELYGYQAAARGRSMAWALIRNKCYEMKKEIPKHKTNPLRP